ncbi:hypothetical protein EO98_11895 [Methanosarcina sp. 2.H.T.1A.6]|nr:hypothetical protein EO94_09530 [Methanosarcina sp. 2.H.T.1A.3]KKG22350.1 hypothetical protein EO97_14940 [Methanosarcina sp. 2.H.T.1A.15]KKG22981.1 hypothetical protein EO98_11895 [Methanosarcina sp. 2.H.T.1A.6]KKG26204.1 hypothetical protein EO96_04380 [Methanosarcina sp. 2.H.T.1A.8]
MKKFIVGNHIQDKCLSFWCGCFPTEQLFSIHTKQRRALKRILKTRSKPEKLKDRDFYFTQSKQIILSSYQSDTIKDA